MRLAIASLATVIGIAIGLAAVAQETPSSKAYMSVNDAMMAEMKEMKPSGDADKDFLTMMISHHKGGIDMSEVEIKYGKHGPTKAMAEKISAAQKKDIAEMEELLRSMK